MARTKVVLTQDVANLGETGQIVTVAGGFARNFLIPRGLALAANKGNLRQVEQLLSGVDVRASKDLAEAKSRAKLLESAPIVVSAQSGPDGRLFGSITAAAIADAAQDAFGVEVDRHTIDLPEPIRHLGFHEVQIKVHREVTAKLTIEAVETPA